VRFARCDGGTTYTLSDGTKRSGAAARSRRKAIFDVRFARCDGGTTYTLSDGTKRSGAAARSSGRAPKVYLIIGWQAEPQLRVSSPKKRMVWENQVRYQQLHGPSV
jgi:rRNA maturation protein Nop10